MMLRTDGTNYQNDVSKCPDEVKSASKYRKNEEQILALRYPNWEPILLTYYGRNTFFY